MGLPAIIEDGLTELHRRATDRRAVIDQQIAEKRTEQREILQRIAAAEALLGIEPKPVQGGGSMTDAIFNVMRDGVSRDAKGIRRALAGLVNDRLLKMPANTLYSTLHRLQSRGRLVRRGSFYRMPDAS